MKTGIGTEIGYTLLLDPLLKDVGLVEAAVFGVVYRHCRMKNGFCYASQERLAQMAGVSRRTVIRHLDNLLESDYLRIGVKDHRLPNGMNTNLYFCTNKAGVESPLFPDTGNEPIPIPTNNFLNYPWED